MEKPHSYPVVLMALFAAAISCEASPQVPSGPSAADTPAPIIVALGDSITAGYGLKPDESYPALLQHRLSASGYRHQIVNAGVSGDTSARALRRLDAALVPDTRILMVALGANDGLRGIPPQTLESNLLGIIERAQARGIDVLLCAFEAPPIGGFEYTLAFHAVFMRLSDKYHVTPVPFMMIGVVGHPEMTLSDRLHPNAAGARLIAERLWPYLEPLLQTTR